MSVPMSVGVPVVPGRDQAREWAIRELSGREYQQARPSLISRAFSWLRDQLNSIGPSDGPGANLGTAIVVGLLLVLIIWAVHTAGGLRRNARGPAGPVLEASERPSAEHYAAADAHARAGDFSAAVVERFRAIVRELEERVVISPQRGRTADEIAGSAAAAIPALAGQLDAAARTFDEVRYGGRAGRAEQDAALRDLATQLRGVRVANLPSPAGR
jgi:hypothetical protein